MKPDNLYASLLTDHDYFQFLITEPNSITFIPTAYSEQALTTPYFLCLGGYKPRIENHYRWDKRLGNIRNKNQAAQLADIFIQSNIIVNVIQHLLNLTADFQFRPFKFFMIAGLRFLLYSLWLIGWLIFPAFDFMRLSKMILSRFNDKFIQFLTRAFENRAHSCGGEASSLQTSLQFFESGFLSVANKCYFDQLIYINSSQFKKLDLHIEV